jgi:hypothetical protein
MIIFAYSQRHLDVNLSSKKQFGDLVRDLHGEFRRLTKVTSATVKRGVADSIDCFVTDWIMSLHCNDILFLVHVNLSVSFDFEFPAKSVSVRRSVMSELTCAIRLRSCEGSKHRRFAVASQCRPQGRALFH